MRKIAFVLSLFLIFMIPWENSVVIAGVGRISKVFGLLTGAFWIGAIIASGRVRQIRPFHLTFFLFILWSFVTALWSVDVDATLSNLTTYLQLGLFMWMIWDLYLTREALNAALQAYVLGASVSVVDTISNYLAGISSGATPRYAAAGFNPNGLAMVLVLGLPIAWYLVVTASNHPSKMQSVLRIVNYAYLPTAVFAVLLTASRTGLLSMAPIILFALASYSRFSVATRLIVLVSLIAAIYFIQPLVPQSSLERLWTTQNEVQAGDLSGRVNIWEEGLDQFEERPLLGVGSGAFVEAVQFKDKTAHNMYLNLLVETGLIGFLLFATVVATAVYYTRHQPRLDAMLWLALVTVWAIGNLTLSWELKKVSWLILSLILVNANLYTEREAEQVHAGFTSDRSLSRGVLPHPLDVK